MEKPPREDTPPARAEVAPADPPAATAEVAPVDPPVETPLPEGLLEVVVLRSGANEPDLPVTAGRVWLGLAGVFLPRDPAGEPERTRVASLDGTGTARFQAVPAGRYPVGVEIGGAALAQAFAQVPASQGARVVVRIGAGGARGTVHALEGGPVAGARLQWSPLGEGRHERVHVVTWTGADGRFEVLHLHGGGYGVGVDLSGWQNPSGGDYARTLELPADRVIEVDFGRPEGLPVWRGRVLTKAGPPADGGSDVGGRGGIHLTRRDRWGYAHHAWDAEGRFEIRLEPGVYDVGLSAPGRDERHLVLEGLEIAERQQSPLQRDLELPGASVHGFIAKGRWIAVRESREARPLLWGPRPEDGQYRIDGLEPGRWWLTADGDAVEFVVLATDAEVRVDLR